jgi:hypothetical protein
VCRDTQTNARALITNDICLDIDYFIFKCGRVYILSAKYTALYYKIEQNLSNILH